MLPSRSNNISLRIWAQTLILILCVTVRGEPRTTQLSHMQSTAGVDVTPRTSRLKAPLLRTDVPRRPQSYDDDVLSLHNVLMDSSGDAAGLRQEVQMQKTMLRELMNELEDNRGRTAELLKARDMLQNKLSQLEEVICHWQCCIKLYLSRDDAACTGVLVSWVEEYTCQLKPQLNIQTKVARVYARQTHAPPPVII